MSESNANTMQPQIAPECNEQHCELRDTPGKITVDKRLRIRDIIDNGYVIPMREDGCVSDSELESIAQQTIPVDLLVHEHVHKLAKTCSESLEDPQGPEIWMRGFKKCVGDESRAEVILELKWLTCQEEKFIFSDTSKHKVDLFFRLYVDRVYQNEDIEAEDCLEELLWLGFAAELFPVDPVRRMRCRMIRFIKKGLFN